MACSSTNQTAEDRKKRVMLSPLPDDFLRIYEFPPSQDQQQLSIDQQTALALQRELMAINNPANLKKSHVTGRLAITIVEAKLAKNYGMTRMDPYVRLRVGHCVYETHTDPNGGKNPRWNKMMYCVIPKGLCSIFLEIYDECSFTMDELIAWSHIKIPETVFMGQMHEDWFYLSGKQGDNVEGAIYLVFSYETDISDMQPYIYSAPPVVMVPSTNTSMFGMRQCAPVTVYQSQQPTKETFQPANTINEKDLEVLEEMFPTIEKEVVKSVYISSKYDKEATVNSLLPMVNN